MLKQYHEDHYKYFSFVSYAHDDDTGWYDWITNFDNELNIGIKSRLRELEPPKTFMSSKNGPINGALSDELRLAIRQSFSMIIFVHDGYVGSEWCLKELEYFREIHGAEAYKTRLFIVAMSQRAMLRLTRKDEWKLHFPKPDPVWIPFHQREEGNPNEPIGIYLKKKQGSNAVISTEFTEPFTRFREKLFEYAWDAYDHNQWLFKEREIHKGPSEPRESEQDPSDVLTYIESEPDRKALWEPLAQQIKSAWEQVMALEPREPPFILRPTGLPLQDLSARPRLDGANGVVLIWDKKARDSVIDQMRRLEPMLTQKSPIPGLIMYVMRAEEPNEDVPRNIQRWPVVRLSIRHDEPDTLRIVADDARDLAVFLRRTLEHKRQLLGH
ncbi:MAG: toll/interleukin-1 receptor domain-containing protein [Rubrivivax sp.]|nr:toll/interleukin-1 receptor domain-containing protein [Rubrivivax sp.]